MKSKRTKVVTKRPVGRKTKQVSGYGVFVRAYGGLIGFSKEWYMAEKLAKTEYSEVSMSRSEDEFKVKPVTIRYSLPHTKKIKKVKK